MFQHIEAGHRINRLAFIQIPGRLIAIDPIQIKIGFGRVLAIKPGCLPVRPAAAIIQHSLDLEGLKGRAHLLLELHQLKIIKGRGDIVALLGCIALASHIRIKPDQLVAFF